MNINEQVQQATQEYLVSDKLKEHITAQAEKMVNDVVSSAFSWGVINDQIKAAIKEQIVLDTSKLGLNGISNLIVATVDEALQRNVADTVREKITKKIEEMTNPLPKVVPMRMLKEKLLSETVESFDICGDMELDMLDGEHGYYESDAFTFIVEAYKDRWVTVYFDTAANVDIHQCKFQITVYSATASQTFKINGREPNKRDAIYGYTWEVENFLMQMYMNDCTMDYAELRAEA